MTNKELNQLYYLRIGLKRINQEIAEIERYGTSKGVDLSGMPPGTGKTSSVEAAAERLDKLKTEKDRILKELQPLEKYIEDLPTYYLREIFRLRYERRMSWTRVAQIIGGGNTGDGVRKACMRQLEKENSS